MRVTSALPIRQAMQVSGRGMLYAQASGVGAGTGVNAQVTPAR